MVEHVLKFTNDERARSGLTPFQSSAALAFIAQNHSENMCETRALEHDTGVFPKGWKSLDKRLELVGLDSGTENIASERRRKPKTWAKHVVKGWMLGTHSRSRMLDPTWRYMGIGVCPCSGNTVYATQVFSDSPGSIR